MTKDPKHLSQLSAADRALAQQQIQNALLAIVASQGRDVEIPLSDLEIVSDEFRLVVEQKDGFLLLSAQLAKPLEIVEAKQHEIEAIAGGKLN